MKLFRFGTINHEKPGLFYAGKHYNCADYFNDWDKKFFDHDGVNQLAQLIKKNVNLPEINIENERFGSCVARPGKIIAIGLNYRDHAEEIKIQPAPEPIIFMKATTAISGPNDDIILPPHSEKTDWEIELGIIIGKTCRYLNTEAEAENNIAGYTISHDVSERAFQLERSGQWTKGKSCDTFNPLGPYLVTKDEISDVLNLSLKLWVNGKLQQNGNTHNLIFRPNYLVYYVSQFMTLEAGDVISTGTPAGVGMSKLPPQFLQPDDVVELEIESLGRQKQRCRRYVK